MAFDVQVLRALSHPLRLQLIELLELAGPLTATEASARIGASPSNCSFHLRVLAANGFVVEAPGGAGRNRPWMLAEGTVRIEVDELDEPGREAVRSFIAVSADRYRRNATNWLNARDAEPDAWRGAAGETQRVLYLSAAEIRAVQRGIDELLAPYADDRRRDRDVDTERSTGPGADDNTATGGDALRAVAISFSAFPLVAPRPTDVALLATDTTQVSSKPPTPTTCNRESREP